MNLLLRALGGLAVLLLVPTLSWAAVGDHVIFKDVDFDTTDTLDLAAPAGQELICGIIDHTDAIEVCSWDGTVEGACRPYSGNSIEPVYLPATETERYRIKAGSGAVNNKYVRAVCVRSK